MKAEKLLVLVAAGLLLVGCKPTEKNYQAAYEAAQKKKQAETAVDPDMVIPAGALQSLDAPKEREVDGVSLRLKKFNIRYAGKGDSPIIERYNVAVSKYKMPTNVAAQSEDLVSKGYKAFPVEAADGSYYVVAATFPALQEAAAFVNEYKKNHDASQFVGLDGEPLVIER